jgi:hypothetical protein
MTPFKVITEAVNEQLAKSQQFRSHIRKKHSEELEDILMELARGRAWIPTLPDGSIAEPVVPSSDVRLRAAIALKEMYDGKAVPQTEIVKAEKEARDLESIRALSDAELEAEASRILASRRPPALNPGPAEDAQLVPPSETTLDSAKLAEQIWSAPTLEEE